MQRCCLSGSPARLGLGFTSTTCPQETCWLWLQPSLPCRLMHADACLQVTHRLEELRMADSASYMADGRIQFSGPATDVLKYMQKMGAHVD